MSTRIGLWRVGDSQLTKLDASSVDLERRLETHITHDPSITGTQLLIVGRQVRTAHGGVIDLLGVDSEGVVHIIELKRAKTPRDVVAQVLDYASWVANLSREDIIGLYKDPDDRPFEEAFAECFDLDTPPDEINAEYRLVIVAAELDSATERIVRYLSDSFGVPINAVLFQHFKDGANTYLARTFIVDEVTSLDAGKNRVARSRETWNGHDWYASFGEEPGGRAWEDARTFGFISAGGGAWFSRTLRNLPVGARVFTYVPKKGYVGIGIVTASAVPFEEAKVEVDGKEELLAAQNLVGKYLHTPSEEDDTAEYIVKVNWLKTVPLTEAVRRSGLFTNRNSACKLRNRFTIESVTDAMGLAPEA